MPLSPALRATVDAANLKVALRHMDDAVTAWENLDEALFDLDLNEFPPEDRKTLTAIGRKWSSFGDILTAQRDRLKLRELDAVEKAVIAELETI